MGMDLRLYRYKGKTSRGYLDYESLDDIYYDTDRYPIRRRFVDEIEWNYIDDDTQVSYGDPNYLMRPQDFNKAYKWAEKLDTGGDMEYCKSLLDIMRDNDDIYLKTEY